MFRHLPTPAIIFLHGGGFVAGDKGGVNPAMLPGALDAGISFAAINYRFVENVFINGGGNPPTPEPPGGMLEFLKKHLLK